MLNGFLLDSEVTHAKPVIGFQRLHWPSLEDLWLDYRGKLRTPFGLSNHIPGSWVLTAKYATNLVACMAVNTQLPGMVDGLQFVCPSVWTQVKTSEEKPNSQLDQSRRELVLHQMVDGVPSPGGKAADGCVRYHPLVEASSNIK